MNNAKLFSDEAANIYERAISTLLKKNMLLYFAYADYEEVSKECRSAIKPTDISLRYGCILETYQIDDLSILLTDSSDFHPMILRLGRRNGEKIVLIVLKA